MGGFLVGRVPSTVRQALYRMAGVEPRRMIGLSCVVGSDPGSFCLKAVPLSFYFSSTLLHRRRITSTLPQAYSQLGQEVRELCCAHSVALRCDGSAKPAPFLLRFVPTFLDNFPAHKSAASSKNREVRLHLFDRQRGVGLHFRSLARGIRFHLLANVGGVLLVGFAVAFDSSLCGSIWQRCQMRTPDSVNKYVADDARFRNLSTAPIRPPPSFTNAQTSVLVVTMLVTIRWIPPLDSAPLHENNRH